MKYHGLDIIPGHSFLGLWENNLCFHLLSQDLGLVLYMVKSDTGTLANTSGNSNNTKNTIKERAAFMNYYNN